MKRILSIVFPYAVIVFLGLSVGYAHGQSRNAPDDSALDAFLEIIEAVRADVDKTEFREQPVPLNKIPPKSFAKIYRLAQEQAYIWQDTILEGDYIQSNEALRLDEVVALRDSQGKPVGFRISYSAKAWATSDCDVDMDRLNEDGAEFDLILASCLSGRIYGSSYVSADLTLVKRNDDAIEEFVED